MDGAPKQRRMIENFQCAGCVCGSKPETCPSYRLESIPWGQSVGFRCASHVIGTSLGNGIRFALGLPKGFNRPGENPETHEPTNCMLIRIWPRGQRPSWDKFNVAVWGYEEGAVTYVRTYSPRSNLTRVDVCEGLSLEEVAPLYDVGAFMDEID